MPRLAVFRCDAAPDIGAGHVTRCLALAEALGEMGWRVAFAVGPNTLAMASGLAVQFEHCELDGRERGEAAALGDRFSQGVDLFVVDHYGRDARFERDCRAWARRILVFDDATGRPHDCDLLVDAAAGGSSAYARLIPPHARALVGPAFALVRGAFLAGRAEALQRRDGRPVGKILLSFGATDPWNVTPVALAALACYCEEISITVAMSSRAPHIEAVRLQLRGRARLALDADVAKLVTEADLAIGASGASSYERAVMGLPSIVLTAAPNQRGLADLMVRAGAVVSCGCFDPGTADRLRRAARRLVSDAQARLQMSRAASNLVDGQGGKRVAEEVAHISRINAR